MVGEMELSLRSGLGRDPSKSEHANLFSVLRRKSCLLLKGWWCIWERLLLTFPNGEHPSCSIQEVYLAAQERVPCLGLLLAQQPFHTQDYQYS